MQRKSISGRGDAHDPLYMSPTSIRSCRGFVECCCYHIFLYGCYNVGKGRTNSVELIFPLPGAITCCISISCSFIQNASTLYFLSGTSLSLTLPFLDLLPTALTDDGFVLRDRFSFRNKSYSL